MIPVYNERENIAQMVPALFALGIPDSDSLPVVIRTFFAFAGWKVVLYFALRTKPLYRFYRLISISFPADKKREKFFSSRSSLDPILRLIRVQNPDIVILNELMAQVHKEKLEKELRALGFVSIVWGLMQVYPDTAVGTVVASKIPAEAFSVTTRELLQLSGKGSPSAGLRLKDFPITIIGCHLTSGARQLSREQVDDVAMILKSEQKNGRSVIVAGDFNKTARNILAQKSFSTLGLASATQKPTCPLWLPPALRWDLDHIFIPSEWHIGKVDYIPFGSDHLAVAAEVHL